MLRGLIVDSFAGGGGASEGIEKAIGRPVDIAINHDKDAIAMHAANHPRTLHVCEDVWHAKLRELVAGRPVDLLWGSPDCKHFSRAKGAKPVNKSIRSLAWILVRWASQVRPAMIALENVREFADWGPVVPQWTCKCGWKGTEGQAILARTRRRCPRCDSLKIKPTLDMMPDPFRKGMTFRLFCNRLRGLGYKVEHRTLNAADYGAPTHRRRLFMIARRDGMPIVWPETTHGDPTKLSEQPLFDRLKPWRTAAECIDWSLPCHSIFDRKKPLADKTLRRIAHGIKRYVLDAAEPFIVAVNHGDSGGRRHYGLDEPMRTVQASSRGGEAIITPILTQYHHSKGNESRCRPLDEPCNTLDTQPRYGLVTPTLIQTGYGERDGQAPRSLDLHQPLGTVVADQKHALVSAFIAKHFGGVVGTRPDVPLGTVTSVDHNAVVAAHLTKFRGECNGVDLRNPLPTITSGEGATRPAGAPHAMAITAANLVRMNHGDKQWQGVDEPLSTITSQGNKAALVYSFLVKYFGTAIGAQLLEPMPTATSKHRFGLVTVTIAGEVYVIVDIGMRMLSPRELARAQGFPDSYVLTGTKTSQVARIGNSVCPAVAQAIVAANIASNVERAIA